MDKINLSIIIVTFGRFNLTKQTLISLFDCGIDDCTQIIIIDNGSIVEDGSPEALLRKSDGLFKKLWSHQVEGFIIDEAI